MIKTYSILVTIVLLLIQVNPLQAQRDMQWTWPIQLHVGMTFMQLEEDSASIWRQDLGSHLMLTTGMGCRYKERLGIDLTTGAHLNTYNFTDGTNSYDVSSFVTMLGGQVYGLIPLRGKNYSFFRLGLEFNRMKLHKESLVNSENDGFVFSSEGYGHSRSYLTPQIGLSNRKNRLFWSLSAGYHFTPEGGYLMRTSVVQRDGGFARYSTLGNSLTLNVGFAITLKGHLDKKEKPVMVPQEDALMVMRPAKVASRLSTSSEKVILKIWDNGDEDQDSISVQLNGQYIISNYELTHKKKKLKLKLREGENHLVFMAHNVGQFPPNTAHCEVKIDRRRQVITMASDLESNAELVIALD